MRRCAAAFDRVEWGAVLAKCRRMDESTFILIIGAFTAVYIAGWLFIGRRG
jgi:hypothetical protein